MSQLKVSIITPSYNRGHLIENTIKSVLTQKYRNIEYIVVDALSTDNTIDILKSYSDRGELRYVSRKDNGMYYAINDGIKMATGDIIAYLNTDDMYFPWTVERAVDVFQKNKDVHMVYGDSMVLDMVNNKTLLNIYASHKRYWLPTGGILCQPTVFLSRRIFDEIGYFNTAFKYLADCEFWLRVNSNPNFNILRIDEIMATECNHGGTFRERFEDEIKDEKDRLMCVFGKRYNSKRSLLLLLKLINYSRKEFKLLKFVAMTFIGNNHYKSPWNNFLKTYSVNFNLKNYILCKLFHDRLRFPRFSLKERLI